MNAFDSAAATLPEKSLGNLRFDESRLISETDALFKGKATDFFSTYLNLSQLHERLNSRDMEIGCRTVQHIGSLLLQSPILLSKTSHQVNIQIHMRFHR